MAIFEPWICAPTGPTTPIPARACRRRPSRCAGAAVIRATAHPEKTDAIYFVASGKGDGSHVFSATLEAHNAAVAAYLARQRQKAAQDSPR